MKVWVDTPIYKNLQMGSSMDLFCKFGFAILIQKVNR